MGLEMILTALYLESRSYVPAIQAVYGNSRGTGFDGVVEPSEPFRGSWRRSGAMRERQCGYDADGSRQICQDWRTRICRHSSRAQVYACDVAHFHNIVVEPYAEFTEKHKFRNHLRRILMERHTLLVNSI